MYGSAKCIHLPPWAWLVFCYVLGQLFSRGDSSGPASSVLGGCEGSREEGMERLNLAPEGHTQLACSGSDSRAWKVSTEQVLKEGAV